MAEMIPRSFLTHDEAFAVCMSDLTDRTVIDSMILEFELPWLEFIKKSKQPPWKNDAFLTFLNIPRRRKLIIFTERIEAIETAIALLSLQKGFEVYLSHNSPSGVSNSAEHRIRQASGFVLTQGEIISELYSFSTQ